MKTLRRIAAGLVAALALAPVVLLAPAAPASAASGTECTITPSSVTLSEKPVKVTFSVRTTPKKWALWSIVSPGTVGADESQRTVTFQAKYLNSLIAGNHSVKVDLTAADHETWSSCATSFQIRRGSGISLTARKVTGGRQFSGKLKRINFGWWYDYHYNPEGTGKPTWSALGGQSVKIQYAERAGFWTTVATTKTKADGTFKVTRKLGQHRWRAVYGGSSITGPRTSKSVTR